MKEAPKIKPDFCPLCQQPIFNRSEFTSLKLRGKNLLLLFKLVERSPSTITAKELGISENAFHCRIYAIRKALQEARSSYYIDSIYGQGYFIWKDAEPSKRLEVV